MLKDVVKEISKVHGYKISSEYWARVGAMRKRYGEDVLLEAIKTAAPKEIPLTSMLNIIEKKCQYLLENGTGSIDELTNDFLNVEES